MITDGEKWHYLAVTKLTALLRGVTSNNNGDFFCLNCFRAYTTENKLETHKKVCKNHDYGYVEMPKEDNKILKYNQGEKAPFIIYADLECLLEKINTCHNNPEKSSTTKINKHKPSDYSLFTYCSFDETKDKLSHDRSKNCMKNFSLDLEKHAKKIINYEKKEMIPQTKEEQKNHNKQKVCYICKEGFNTDDSDKKYHEVKDHCHYTGKYGGAAHYICNLRYKTSKAIPVVFHNGSIYDHRFIVKDLAEESEGEFECLGENTEKYITFSIPIKKGIRKRDKDGDDKIIKISYKIKLIDSFRYMSTSLSNLVSNLSERLHNDRCIDCKSCLDYMSIKDNQLIFRCSSCKEIIKKNFNKELIKRFANTYRFYNKDLNKFILLLRKGVYLYEYMDNWERFSETLLPNKEVFYSNLNVEDITDTDYTHANKLFKEFKIKHLGKYHDLHVQSDTLLLADLFENFRNECMKVYELDPANFLTAPGLAWQACLKKTDVKLALLTNFNMLLMVEEGIRGGMCHAIHRYTKANNKYIKNYNEKEDTKVFTTNP